MPIATTASERYVAGLAEIETQAGHSTPYVFSVTPGRRYDKIVQRTTGRDGKVVEHSASVHAFVDRTSGAVLKAEGWNKPAPGIRFETIDDALAVAWRDPYRAAFGSYLYR